MYSINIEELIKDLVPITYHSKLSFDIWKNIIDNLIDVFSVRRITEENNAQSDEKYFKINLKGTKSVNMPRYSKKKISKDGTIRGISHHQICVISTIDENDNLFFKIGGLGRGTTEMLENCISSHLGNLKTIVTDSESAYQEFCRNHKINLMAISSHFQNDEIHNIAEINNVNSQLETWICNFRGISTRHLQRYLNWVSYMFMKKKRFE